MKPIRSSQPPARAEEILDDALEHEPAGRLTLIAEACGSDVALRAEVDALLAAHDAMPTGFLAVPAVEEIEEGDLAATVRHEAEPIPPLLVTAEQEGAMIGHYKLREKSARAGSARYGWQIRNGRSGGGWRSRSSNRGWTPRR